MAAAPFPLPGQSPLAGPPSPQPPSPGQPLASPSPLGTPQPGTGYQLGQPGFTPPPPSVPTPGLDPELTTPVDDVYSIDPLVLDRPVRMRIEGSSRMLSRSALQQIWPFLAQAALNGPFLQGMAMQGMTVDFVEMIRMLEDASGTMRSYRIFRPMNQQEQQMRQMPSPDARVKLQLGQQEQQTRQQIMQTKVQGQQALEQLRAMVKDKEIDEASARHILSLLQQENSGQAQRRHEVIQNTSDRMHEARQNHHDRRLEGQQALLQHHTDLSKARLTLAQGLLSRSQGARQPGQGPPPQQP